MLLVWWSSLLVEDKSLTTSVLLFHVPFWSPKRSISLSGNHISSILVYVAKSTVATSQDLLTFMCVTRIQPAFLLLLLTEHLHCSLKICHAASKSEVHQRKVIVFWLEFYFLRSNFTCLPLIITGIIKISGEGNDNRSPRAKGTNVCGWCCLNFYDRCSKVMCQHMDKAVHFKDVTQGETVKLRKPKHLDTIKPTLTILLIKLQARGCKLLSTSWPCNPF